MKYTINELANSKGVSQPVREALLQMEAVIVKANAQAEHFEREWYLRGDELEATNRQVEILSDALAESRREVAALKAVQEPVRGWWAHTSPITGITDVQDWQLTKDDKARGWIEREIYTTPPAAQRLWVGLTNEEIAQIYLVNTDKPLKPEWLFARAIERKLKEKNT